MIRLAEGAASSPKKVVLFDGICGLCHFFVNFLLARDHKDSLRFASLQSDFARSALQRYGVDAAALDSVFVIDNLGSPHECLQAQAEAVFCALDALGGRYRRLSRIGRMLPRSWVNLGYRTVARLRYRLFGQFAACPIPTPAQRHKFLDLSTFV